jgi:hypothetical protein
MILMLAFMAILKIVNSDAPSMGGIDLLCVMRLSPGRCLHPSIIPPLSRATASRPTLSETLDRSAPRSAH